MNKAVKTPKNIKEDKMSDGRARGKSVLHHIVQWGLWILTVISILGILAASFGGNFNPYAFKGLSIMELTMPVWLTFMIIVTILDLLWCRKAFVFCVLTFIACANAIWEYCPMNIFGPSEKKYAECPKFTLLTYNIASFYNMQGEYPDGINPTVSYIIKKNADVVCLQETEVTLSGPFKAYHITSSQIDSINSLYPYRLLYGGFLTVLSKYPLEAIHTPPLCNDSINRWRIYPIGVFRLNIEGLPVTLFDVHLQSYGLSRSDKNLYKNIAEGKEISDVTEGSLRTNLHDIKHQIFDKVQYAAEKRADEADALCRYIEKFGGPNVIIAGDFNDVPGCYTLNRLKDYKMKQVYPELGFGPMVTYNADMFYFRIDHVLYRGGIVPLKISRGSIKFSDHYPLEVTFAITGNP